MVQTYKNILKVVFFALIFPLVIGFGTQDLISGHWPHVALHASLEAITAILALLLAFMLFKMQSQVWRTSEYLPVVLVFLMMGVFDLFHAFSEPGNLFIWHHTVSVLLGGLLLSSVWLWKRYPAYDVSKPWVVMAGLISLVLVLFLHTWQDILPSMLNRYGDFSGVAKLLNFMGGIGFLIGSSYYLVRYLNRQQKQDLVIFGGGLLIGASALLFTVSKLWDFQWFVWHLLRLTALMFIMWALYQAYMHFIRQLVEAEKSASSQNQALTDSMNVLQQHYRILDQSSVVSKTDLNGLITYANDKLLDLTGYTREELLGKSHNILKAPSTSDAVFERLWKTILSGQMWQGQIKNRKKNGEIFEVQMFILPLRDQQGKVSEFIALSHDITHFRQAQASLTKVLVTDALTGLPNRTKLIQELDAKKIKSIALLNIDSFKEINDFLGIEHGDTVIRLVAEYLQKVKDPALQLYRLHGDEFALAEVYSHPVLDLVDQVKKLVRRIPDSVFHVEGHDIMVSLSSGIALHEAEGLLAYADMALREAKKLNQAMVLHNEMSLLTDKFKENLIWSRELKSALNEGRIVPVYQAIYDVHKEQTVAYECLVRMKSDGKLISPFFFLDIAKKSRLYPDLTRTVLMHAFETFKEREERFSVNLSAEDLETSDTLQFLQQLCQSYGTGNRLTIEITETEGIENFSEAVTFLDNMRALGAKVAIDDYGTGYSNFEYLMRLQPDYIKLDGSLIRDIVQDSDKELIVETIVSFAQKRQIKTVAEFVEDNQTYLKLKEMGVDLIQGYFIAEPQLLLPQSK